MSLGSKLSELPEEVIALIFQNINDSYFLIDISGIFPNKYIFPYLFQKVSIISEPSSSDNFSLLTKSGSTKLKFSLNNQNYVEVYYRNSHFKFQQMDLIKRFISELQIHYKEDSNNASAPDAELVKFLCSDLKVTSLHCTSKLNGIPILHGLKKYKTTSLESISKIDTTSLVSLDLYNYDYNRATILISGKKFPNLLYLNSSVFGITVVDFTSVLKEMTLHSVLPSMFPSIDPLKNLKALNLMYCGLEVVPTLYICKLPSQSLRYLSITGMSINLLSLKPYPILKKLSVQAEVQNIQDIPSSLEEISVASGTLQSFSELKDSNLRHISLYYCKISNLDEILSQCSKLISLSLCRDSIEPVPEILRSSSLAHLSIQSCQISALKALHFPNLKALSFVDTILSSTPLLDDYQSLTELNLKGCNISSIDVVQNFPNLKILNIERNQIKSIEPLRYTKYLEYLELGGNSITNLEPLKHCSKLRELYANSNEVSFLDLEELKMLQEVDVMSNTISYLRFSERLRKLVASENRLSSTRSLSNLKSIEELDLRANLITKLEGLDQLRCLKKLRLTGNKISTLKGIEKLISLEDLDVASNSLESLDGLDALTKLKNFLSTGAKIEELDGKLLHNLHNLKSFTMQFGILKIIKNLRGLRLNHLDLSNNKIEVLKEINNNNDLSTLHLQNNYIHTIDNTFAQLPSLLGLNLSNNKLKTLDGLEKINSDSSLRINIEDIELGQYDKSSLPYNISTRIMQLA